MTWEPKSYWELIAALAAAAVLILSTWEVLLSPLVRRRRLKHPCDAYFHIRPLEKGGLPYVIQDDRAHRVKQLVLPSNSLVEIEVAYIPKIPFNVMETVVQCDGDFYSKPLVEERIAPFVLSGEVPAGPTYVNREGGFHYASRYSGRAEGSCYSVGFMVRTRKPGVYPAWLGFLTDEIDGEARGLTLRVEAEPSIRMRCIEHRRCTLGARASTT